VPNEHPAQEGAHEPVPRPWAFASLDVHAGWVDALLDIRPPPALGLTARCNSLCVGALARDTEVAGEEEGEDSGELRADEKYGRVWAVGQWVPDRLGEERWVHVGRETGSW
jgi:hypothetical protein